MTRPIKLIGGAVVLFAVLLGGLYAYRSLMLLDGRTPENDQLLTPMPGSTGFEPTTQPSGPVLENQSSLNLSVDFGYKVAGIPYSYALVLAFPSGGDSGHATLTVRHGPRSATMNSDVVRRWDAPRRAYVVALAGAFDTEPAVPAVCMKAVIGPSLKQYDLANASLCIAQRDASGNCHPESLACGLIR